MRRSSCGRWWGVGVSRAVVVELRVGDGTAALVCEHCYYCCAAAGRSGGGVRRAWGGAGTSRPGEAGRRGHRPSPPVCGCHVAFGVRMRVGAWAWVGPAYLAGSKGQEPACLPSKISSF